MNTKRVISIFIIVAGLILVLAACGGKATEAPVVATEAPVAATEAPVAATEAPVALSGDTIRGAKLYDNWMKELGADVPAAMNPQWVAAKAGDTTVEKSYRCVICHGWSYNGEAGFAGVSASAGQDANGILAILKGSTDANHDFSAFMDEQALTDAALYISEQQIDVAAVVAMTGNGANGKTLFTDNCVECHGPDTVAISFHPDNAPEYPANIANEDPMELLGKLRFGQPGIADMPSGVDIGLTDQDYADMTAFLKAQPTASPVTEGGRMYDNWIAAFGATAPETTQPLWTGPLESGGEVIAAEDTWRCASCHGWDYNGDAGFKGILADKNLSAADLTAWLDGTKNADHNYSSYFTADDMGRMVAFIQQGIVDKSTFINADGTVNGDAAHGKELFNASCKTCHGEDGKSINFMEGEGGEEYFGSVAVEAPFEFFNKASFGQPGEAMPAGLNLGWTLQDFADVLAFAQTLPTK
ncbi:MAG: c-type cytochrome [Chloroflexi bacterium]|nr:c-type cytochrome [Chloroflexota bacterium]